MLDSFFTLHTLLLTLGVVFLALLSRYFRRRRIYLLFLLLLLGSGAAFYYSSQAVTSETVTPEERNARLLQQQLVARWHQQHQHTIDTLDHTWKQYHLVLQDFQADVISLEETHLRLQRLEKQQAATLDALRATEPPQGLEEENYNLVLTVLQKTRSYAAQQQRTLHLSVAATDPDRQLSPAQPEQSRTLQEVMLREAPAGLFTATEISALRDNVSVPE